jgi:hypothetical protein
MFSHGKQPDEAPCPRLRDIVDGYRLPCQESTTRFNLAQAQAPRECVTKCDSTNFSCSQNCGLSGACVAQCNATAVAPFDSTAYALSLRTPLASRQLGMLDLTVDHGACQSVAGFIGNFAAIVKGQANAAFPTGGQVALRGSGTSIDIGFNSFVVDVPLTVSVPNWFDPDIDTSLGFSVYSQNGTVHVTNDFAETTVSFGTASSVLSLGCSAFVASALEQLSDGFLSGFIGPVLAERLEEGINDDVGRILAQLNQGPPPPRIPFLRPHPHGRRLELSFLLHSPGRSRTDRTAERRDQEPANRQAVEKTPLNKSVIRSSAFPARMAALW